MTIKAKQILNRVTWGVLLVLLAPAGLIIASQNAVPGDGMYPVKTTLEDIALLVTSPSYAATSDMQMRFTKRRLSEVEQVVNTAYAVDGLDNLNDQVVETSASIEQVENDEKRVELAQEYIQTLRDTQVSLEEQKSVVRQQAAYTYSQPSYNSPSQVAQNNTQPVNNYPTLENAAAPAAPTDTNNSNTTAYTQPVNNPPPAQVNQPVVVQQNPVVTTQNQNTNQEVTEESAPPSEEVSEKIEETQKEIEEKIKELEEVAQQSAYEQQMKAVQQQKEQQQKEMEKQKKKMEQDRKKQEKEQQKRMEEMKKEQEKKKQEIDDDHNDQNNKNNKKNND